MRYRVSYSFKVSRWVDRWIGGPVRLNVIYVYHDMMRDRSMGTIDIYFIRW